MSSDKGRSMSMKRAILYGAIAGVVCWVLVVAWVLAGCGGIS